LTGSKWVPAIPGASASNHDANVSVSTTITSYSGPIIGLQQGYSGKTISVPFTLPDLGNFGAITLQAQTNSFPAGLVGSAIPFLVSLVDPNGKEWVNLDASCVSGGFYDCSNPSTGCVAQTTCNPNWPSAFASREHWEEHQLLNSGDGYPSVNTFPTCTWTTTGGNTPGSNPPSNFPKCAFKEDTSSWLTGTKLPAGGYVAKYVLVANSYNSFSAGAYTGGFEFRLVQRATGTTIAGAVDLNVILVGTTNVNASRTAKGQQNLNTLLGQVGAYYAQAGTGIKIGSVNAIEWPCDSGGDSYANVGTSGLGGMFAEAKCIIPSGEGRALNVFLTETIQNDVSSLGSGVVIDGFSGAIGGPVTNGTPASGLVFATFDKLDSYNSTCNPTHATCALTEQEDAFWNMETTITHEMGHFLGLNHPNESDGTVQDQLYDTPVCTAVSASLQVLTINSCLNVDTTNQLFSTGTPAGGHPHSCHEFCTGYNSMTGVYCPAVTECAFNDVMWYTSKNFTMSNGQGDGNIFSPETGALLNLSPYVQ
jgi:hypothetical protein